MDDGFDLGEVVIGAAFEVSNCLGAGFLERVYSRALVRELGIRGVAVRREVPFRVHFKGFAVGDYVADIVVEDRLIVELKCVARLGDEHLAQCLNYLRASGMEVCYLLNFQQPRVEWRRVVLSRG